MITVAGENQNKTLCAFNSRHGNQTVDEYGTLTVAYSISPTWRTKLRKKI